MKLRKLPLLMFFLSVLSFGDAFANLDERQHHNSLSFRLLMSRSNYVRVNSIYYVGNQTVPVSLNRVLSMYMFNSDSPFGYLGMTNECQSEVSTDPEEGSITSLNCSLELSKQSPSGRQPVRIFYSLSYKNSAQEWQLNSTSLEGEGRIDAF